MAIIIDQEQKLITLHTKNTTYQMGVGNYGQLLHLYYGKRLTDVYKRQQFTQRIAYSTDGGETLHKIDKSVLPTVCKENRDPKVFWHEKSGAYIMTLWLEENDFGIFRSTDLLNWEQTDRLTCLLYTS